MSELALGDVALSTLQRGAAAALPLLFVAVGELLSQRAGLLNIGVEGLMLVGALAATLAATASGSAWVGLAAAVGAAALVGGLFVLWTVAAKRDQVVTGLGMNLLAIGLTGMAIQRVEARGRRLSPPRLPTLGGVDLLLVGGLLLVAATTWLLHRTRAGLSLRAVGENPAAADAAGVRVVVVRAAAGLSGAALAGLGGAYLSLGLAGGFQEQMTGGRGFLALALVVFGRWSPVGVMLAALFFGLLEALQVTLQPSLGTSVHLLYPALLALPYVATLAALAGLTGRARPPAGLGVPYDRQ